MTLFWLVIKLGVGAGVGALLGAAPFYRTPSLIGCLDTATAPDIVDLGVQLPAFDVLFVLNIARRQSEVR